MRHGTWQETGGGGSPAGLVVLALAAVALSGAAEGIAQAVAFLVTVLVIAAAVLAVLVAAGFAAYRIRRNRAGTKPRLALIPAPVVHERAIPERARPALEAPKPQVVNNFFGVTPDQVAEILRQQSAGDESGPDWTGISRPGSVPTTSDRDRTGRWER